jgi:hypothetical protein
VKGKTSTFTDLTFHRNRSAVRFDKRFRDGESKELESTSADADRQAAVNNPSEKKKD